MRYVLVKNVTDEIIKEVDGDKVFLSGVPEVIANKPFRWLPLVVVNPPVDTETEVKEGPVDVITATECTRTWTVREKTAQESSNLKDKQTIAKLRDLKIVISALNDGSFVPGQNYTNSQLKAIMKAHL